MGKKPRRMSERGTQAQTQTEATAKVLVAEHGEARARAIVTAAALGMPEAQQIVQGAAVVAALENVAKEENAKETQRENKPVTVCRICQREIGSCLQHMLLRTHVREERISTFASRKMAREAGYEV